MHNAPVARNLRIGSFAAHAARGLIRDQTTRRWAMFFTLLAAMLMLFFGGTFLQPLLSPHEHPAWFILFWLACAWFTLTALLLALFDLLMVRAQSRAATRELRETLDPDVQKHVPPSHPNEASEGRASARPGGR
jgi:hypothetical protein